jgi:alpha-galactosidase
MPLVPPKYVAMLLCLSLLPAPFALAEKSPSLQNENVSLSCDVHTGACNLRWKDGTQIGPFVAAVEIDGGKRWASADFPKHEIHRDTAELTIRNFGAPEAPELVQHFHLAANQPFVLVDVEAISTTPIATRHIAPLVLSSGGSARLASGEKPSVIFTPWDNDMWVHYNEPANPDPKAQFDPSKDPDSYEVTAIYDNLSRHGLVLGSITHDTWRTGILARKLSPRRVDELEVYGGAAGHWSHDIEPHGLVSGATVKSPQIMVGYFRDWRDGLEAYGKENARIHPPLPWNEGVPFGWNSWAAYAMSVTPAKYLGVADYLHTQLQPRGYQDHNTVYVNWDAGWNTFKEDELIAVAKHVHAQGQKAGIYYTPFSYWSDDFTKPVEGTNGKYTYNDLLLRDSHGQPLPKIDGAHPLDPTHPGTIERIDYEMARFVAWGYDSVKMDFLNCGSVEGVHHDPKITTGVEAYNFGMKRIEDDLAPAKIGRPFFISLSIAPLFPAHGHARRISCDAFGRIQDSDYLLNAVTYGWWTNGTLFAFNDPDHTVIAKDKDPYHDQSLPNSVQTLDEARSRMNASVIAGTLLIDSDDLLDAKAQARAQELLTNKAILDLARAGRSFRPVDAESGIHATPIFERLDSDDSIYIAAFNYSEDKPATLELDLTRIGLNAKKSYAARDLWTNASQSVTGKMTFHLAAGQSQIVHITAK